jgi:2-keto-3-deoxy-galactonokinase
MWLAVDAAGGAGVRAWAVGEPGVAGPAIEAPDLAQALARQSPAPSHVVVDGSADAKQLDRPSGVADLAAATIHRRRDEIPCALLPALALDGETVEGTARLAGALALMQAGRPTARGQHVCLVGRDVLWAHAAAGSIGRLRRTATGARLERLLADRAVREAGGEDEDDDVAFERGLSLCEDGGDPEPRIRQVLDQAASGARRGGALGAMLAGVLIGADAAAGLKLGRLGGPAALVGPADPRYTLTAQRYATALGRFGVAVRRLDPLAAFLTGCRALAGNKDLSTA